jgi:hypothetical protein
MKPTTNVDEVGGYLVAMLVSGLVAAFAALGAFVLTIFVGAKFFTGESGYGLGLAFGSGAAVAVGAVTWVLFYQKLRRLY